MEPFKILLVIQDTRLSDKVAGLLREGGFEIQGQVDSALRIMEYVKVGAPFVLIVTPSALKSADDRYLLHTVRTHYGLPVLLLDTDEEEGPKSDLNYISPVRIVPPLSIGSVKAAIETAIYIIQIESKCRWAEEGYQSSRNMTHALLNSITEMALLGDEDGGILALNNASVLALDPNRPLHEFLGRNVFGFIPKEAGESRKARYQDAVREGRPSYFEDYMGGRSFENRMYPVMGNNGKPDRVVWFSRDITEKKQMDEALGESEEHFRSLAENSPDLICRYDRRLRHLYVNPPWLKTLGLPATEVLGRTFQDLGFPESVNRVVEQGIRQVFETGRHHRAEIEIETQTGQLTLDLQLNPEFDAQRNVATVIGVSRDISPIRKAQDALKQSEATLRSIFRAAPIGIGLSVERVLKWVNNRLCIMVGYSQEELLGKGTRVLYPDDREYLRAGNVKQGTMIPTGAYAVEVKWLHRDGRLIDVLLSATRLEPENPQSGVIFTALDITERTEAKQALAVRNRISTLFLTSPEDRIFHDLLDIVCDALCFPVGLFGYIDDNNRLITTYYTNENAEADDDNRIGRVVPPSAWTGFWGRALKEKRTVVADLRITPFPGLPALEYALAVPILYRKSLVGLFIVAGKPDPYRQSDVQTLKNIADHVAPILHAQFKEAHRRRENERLESQLRQSQKMEAIGTLASGIAHDFNNILGAILGYAELGLINLEDDDPLRQDLNPIIEATNRAKKLVKQILTFSRRTEQQLEPVAIRPLVSETIKFLRSSLPTTIEIQYDLNCKRDTILADPTQIHQVVMNLGTNAAHAMKDRGGLLKITLENVFLSKETFGIPFPLPEGDYLKLSMIDNGLGIPLEIVDRIFEPYFTTKKPAEGTGMGLAVVHGIVKSHGGDIRVYSEPDNGSNFEIFLPLIGKQAEVTEEFETYDFLLGTERILFVDDEINLVEIGRKMLERLGYQVTHSTSGLDALDLFKKAPHDFDLLITDQTMPKMTGLTLVEEIKRLRPDLPIILCTGYSHQVTESKALKAGVDRFLLKPVDLRALAGAIRETLDKV